MSCWVELSQTESSSDGSCSDGTAKGEYDNSGHSRRELAPAEAVSQDDESPGEVCWRRSKAYGGIAVLVILFIGGCVFHKQVAEFVGEVMAVSAKLGYVSAVPVALLNAGLCVLMLPTFPLYIASSIEFTKLFGMSIGMLLAFIACFSGLWLGSVVSFQLGRTIWRDYAKKGEHKETALCGLINLKVINRMIDEEGMKMVFLARMSPFLPAEIFNYACSVTKIAFVDYAVGCLGSAVPIGFWVFTTAEAAHATDGGAHKHWLNNLLFMVFNVALLVVLTAMLYLSYSRFRDAEQEAAEQNAELKLMKA